VSTMACGCLECWPLSLSALRLERLRLNSAHTYLSFVQNARSEINAREATYVSGSALRRPDATEGFIEKTNIQKTLLSPALLRQEDARPLKLQSVDARISH
jgi:hypothetical protein